MPRADGKVEMVYPPWYSCHAWLTASPSEDGCALQIGTKIADKLGRNALLVTVGVITEADFDSYLEPAPRDSECEQVECYRYYVHFAAVMGIGVSISKVAGISSTLEMARHDHYIDLKVWSDGRSWSNVTATRTSGPPGDRLKLTEEDHLGPPSITEVNF